MALIDRIERIQQSPPSTRRMILIVSVTLIMAAIISIWMAQLKYELREDAAAPSLADGFGSVWKKIKEQKPNFSQ
ncbi:MAG: hypothetical protein EXS68_02985 [Candidatus Ryanbacteria bacterium]|nr:hypothetical protein [Candidatus Ryanbacteria bacterium]